MTVCVLKARAEALIKERKNAPVTVIIPACYPTVISVMGPPQILSVEMGHEPEAGVPVYIRIRTQPGFYTDEWPLKKRLKVVEGRLFYTVDDGKTWADISLKETAGNIWEGEIPAYPEGTTVLYYTRFRDEHDDVATESKPDFKKENVIEMEYEGGKKTMVFPSEKDLVLTYENKGYDPAYFRTKEWEAFQPGVVQKTWIKKTWFSQDEDNYYFLVEFYEDVSVIENLYYLFHGTDVGVSFYNADKVEAEPEKIHLTGDTYVFVYWMLLPTDFLDTRLSNCRACVVMENVTNTYLLGELEENSVMHSGNKVYFTVDRSTVKERPERLIKLETTVCSDNMELRLRNMWLQLTWTASTYVYLRTHSYEL